jgi:thymidylate kinase
MDQKSIDFWERSVNKMFWLGIALVTAFSLNTATKYWNMEDDEDQESKKDVKKRGVLNVDSESRSNSTSAKKIKNKKAGISDDDTFKDESPITGQDTPKFKTIFNIPASPDQITKRKQSIDTIAVKGHHFTNVYTIAFTGGPCAGKTTAISYCAERLKELGFAAICVPEAATLIFSSGGVLNMATYTPYQGIEFQKSLMKLQMALEDIFTRIVTINCSKDTCFVLCDRGLMDGKAYLSTEQWDVLLNEMGLYEQDIKDYRYDLVVHFITAADGAPEHYQLLNNKARDEDLPLAIELDQKIKDAWSNHPNYLLVTNECADFESKIKLAFDYILALHGYPTDTDFTIKLLMNNSTGIFDKIVRRYSLEVFTITDTFLDKSSSDKEASPAPGQNQHSEKVVYIRKRVNTGLHIGT